MGVILRTLAAWLACAVMLGSANAQNAAADQESQAAFEAARKAQVTGPADVPVRDQAILKLPEGYVFIPKAEGERLLQAMGNRGGESLAGLVFPTSGEGWFAVVRYIQEGHIADDEARDWKADELLTNLREGTEAANEDRVKRGITPMEVVGWAEPPRYDAASHRLVWSASTRDKGTTGTEGLGVNYNTYALGREGYISLNLVTALAALPKHKAEAQRLLGALEYQAGRKYTDFNASTDKVAAYGLAALVAGVAAKKLGLLALLVAFVLKFAKVIALGVGAVGWGVAKRFKRQPAAPVIAASGTEVEGKPPVAGS